MYDHVPGKADWLAHGLATEGEQIGMPRAKHALRHDVPTATLDEPLDQVQCHPMVVTVAYVDSRWLVDWVMVAG